MGKEQRDRSHMNYSCVPHCSEAQDSLEELEQPGAEEVQT